MNYQLAAMLVALYFVVANPMMYDLVDRIVPVKDLAGVTQMGVLLHALVFTFLLALIASPKRLNKLMTL